MTAVFRFINKSFNINETSSTTLGNGSGQIEAFGLCDFEGQPRSNALGRLP